MLEVQLWQLNLLRVFIQLIALLLKHSIRLILPWHHHAYLELMRDSPRLILPLAASSGDCVQLLSWILHVYQARTQPVRSFNHSPPARPLTHLIIEDGTLHFLEEARLLVVKLEHTLIELQREFRGERSHTT